MVQSAPEIIYKPCKAAKVDKQTLSYKDAGVDINAGNELVDRMKPHVKRTRRPEVIGGLGGFGALCAIPAKF